MMLPSADSPSWQALFVDLAIAARPDVLAQIPLKAASKSRGSSLSQIDNAWNHRLDGLKQRGRRRFLSAPDRGGKSPK